MNRMVGIGIGIVVFTCLK